MPEMPEHRCAQLVQTGERELHLRLHARRPSDPASRGGLRQMPQQGGLADAGLAAQDEHPALARAHSDDESIEYVALPVTVQQPRCWQLGVKHAVPHSRVREVRAATAPTIVGYLLRRG